jgi:predicted PurR-regulated permease PerM
MPWLGGALQLLLARYVPDPQDLLRYLAQPGLALLRRAIGWIGDIGWNFLKIVFSSMVLLVLYRDGEALGMQAAKVLRHLIGRRSASYLEITRNMSRVVVRSAVLAALLQGLVAGLGYWVAGAGTPALLSIATAIASLVPVVGTALVWGTVAVVLIASGNFWQGLGLLAWGLVFVHPIDNVIRPALIGNAARVPFVLMIFGIFGGIAAFGLIGVFLGPLILAIGSAAWKDWVDGIPEPAGAADTSSLPPVEDQTGWTWEMSDE